MNLLIVGTITGDYITPSAACEVRPVDAVNAMAFDINAACTGFMVAMNTADHLLSRLEFTKILAK